MRLDSLLDEGPIDYMEADAIQRDLHDRVAAMDGPDTLLAWEAKDTYTAGRRTKPEDIPDHSIPVIPMDRGGSVTYHGPGQLVIYPIMKVKPPKDVVAFVRATEEAIIRVLARSFGLHSCAIEGRSGVWFPGDTARGAIDKKVCAIGMKFAQDATMHGLALNVSTDLTKFDAIVPCGLRDAGVTSLAEQGVHATLDEVLSALVPELSAQYLAFQRPERVEKYGTAAA